MGRACLICLSLHRDEYNSQRLGGTPIKTIYENAVKAHPEEKINYWNFQKHFQNHIELPVRESIEMDKLRERVIEESIKKDIQIARRLTTNLEICAEKIGSKLQLEAVSPEDERILLEYLGETRMIIEQLLKWSTKLNLEQTSGEIFNKILKCMIDFPPDLVYKFQERWNTP